MAVLKRCEKTNLMLNRQFGISEVTHIGHILNSAGVQPSQYNSRDATTHW